MFAKMTKKTRKDLCPVILIARTRLIKFPRQVFCAPECSLSSASGFSPYHSPADIRSNIDFSDTRAPLLHENGIHHSMHPVKTSFTNLNLSQNQRICHRSVYIPSYTFTQRSKNSVSCTRPRASSAAATMPIHSFTYSRVQPCFSQYLAMYFSASSFSSLSSRRK